MPLRLYYWYLFCLHVSNYSLLAGVGFADTLCLRQQLAGKRSKRLGAFVPKCRPDGEYEEMQCHGSVCFCVDEGGEEIVGTRVPRHHSLNCKSQSPPGKGTELDTT